MNFMTQAQKAPAARLTGKAAASAKVEAPKVEAGALFDWPRIGTELDAQGYAVISSVLSPNMCNSIAKTYEDEALFRSTITMAHHGYGRGEYKYFAYPLPLSVSALRTNLYPPLAAIANRWNDMLGIEMQYPMNHAAYLEHCHAEGQNRPTPLMLTYGEGDYNSLHQDLYGDQVFPFQATILLSRPGADFTGGEFVISEQRPRMQARAEVVPLMQGDAVIFPVWHRPIQGNKGYYRAAMKHGVSKIRRGHRKTLGIIFHDAM
jgi:hypothetical protein